MEETSFLNNNDDKAAADQSRMLTRKSTVVDLDAARAQIKEAEETKRLLKQFAEIRKLCAGEITSTRSFTCRSCFHFGISHCLLLIIFLLQNTNRFLIGCGLTK